MKKLIAIILAVAPGVAGAAQITNATGVISKFNDLVNAAIPVLITFAVLYIIYAVVMYMIAGDEDKKKASKGMVGWGIAGLFIILSIWGLVNILVGTFDLKNSIPQDRVPKAVEV